VLSYRVNVMVYTTLPGGRKDDLRTLVNPLHKIRLYKRLARSIDTNCEAGGLPASGGGVLMKPGDRLFFRLSVRNSLSNPPCIVAPGRAMMVVLG